MLPLSRVLGSQLRLQGLKSSGVAGMYPSLALADNAAALHGVPFVHLFTRQLIQGLNSGNDC